MKKILRGKRSGVKTRQAAEPPYSASNGPIKITSENIRKRRRIYEILYKGGGFSWQMHSNVGLRFSILLIVQKKVSQS